LKRKGEGSNVGSFFRVLELNLMALSQTLPFFKGEGRVNAIVLSFISYTLYSSFPFGEEVEGEV
jgi:hypothetical protein